MRVCACARVRVQVRLAGAAEFRTVASLGPGRFANPSPAPPAGTAAAAVAPSAADAGAASAGPGGVLGADGSVYVPLVHSDEWLYIDDEGREQGPFSYKQMAEWYEAEYFGPATKVKRAGAVPAGAVDYIQFEEIGEDGLQLFSNGSEEVARQNSQPLPLVKAAAQPAAAAATAGAPAAAPAAPAAGAASASVSAPAAAATAEASKPVEILWQYIDDQGE